MKKSFRYIILLIVISIINNKVNSHSLSELVDILKMENAYVHLNSYNKIKHLFKKLNLQLDQIDCITNSSEETFNVTEFSNYKKTLAIELLFKTIGNLYVQLDIIAIQLWPINTKRTFVKNLRILSILLEMLKNLVNNLENPLMIEMIEAITKIRLETIEEQYKPIYLQSSLDDLYLQVSN